MSNAKFLSFAEAVDELHAAGRLRWGDKAIVKDFKKNSRFEKKWRDACDGEGNATVVRRNGVWRKEYAQAKADVLKAWALFFQLRFSDAHRRMRRAFVALDAISAEVDSPDARIEKIRSICNETWSTSTGDIDSDSEDYDSDGGCYA